jgi:hypothetical protein
MPPNIDLVVVGAHLSGMPLNHELVALAACFVRSGATAPLYRLFELPGAAPRKPGMLRVGEGGGTAIEIEIWSLSVEAFGMFVSRIPAPLGIGTIWLENGSVAKGFLVESIAVKAARDISDFGGWRSFQEQAALA